MVRFAKRSTADCNRWLRRYFISAASSLTVALVLHTGAFIWWASAINTRVGQLEIAVEKISGRVYGPVAPDAFASSERRKGR